MNTQKKSLGRLASGVGVAALALAGVMGGASMASADVGPDQPGAPESGTLVVHKYAGSTTGDDNNGTEQTINRPPLAGVTFSVTPVGEVDGSDCVALDLTTAAGWTAAQAAVVDGALADGYGLVDADAESLTTGNDGIATFSGLDLGMYFVDETDSPEGVTSAVDFFVTIPYPSTSGDATDWLYTVHTYPKNDLDGDGSKTVADPSGHGLGSTVPWTITTKPLGSFADGQTLTRFDIVDRLDDKLTYVTDSAEVSYTTPGGTETPVAVADVTYTEPTGAGGELRAALDVDFVNSLQAGTIFTLTFDTTVTGVGDIVNEGFQNANGTETNLGEASTQWGAAELLKHQTGDTSKTLAGAEFQVYDSIDGVCPADADDLGDPLAVNGETAFTSGNDGVVEIAGLFVSNNNESPNRVYCVVETVAPAGYALIDTPLEITVVPGTTAAFELEVPNPLVDGPTLPLTGANGTLWFTVGGIALIVIAGGALMMVRRQRTHS